MAEAPDGGGLIAVARYEPAQEPGVVEVAFVVQDDWQGRGLGTRLLADLLEAARANGIERFRAWVLADNRRMLDLLARFTDVTHRVLEQGVYRLEFGARPAGPDEPPTLIADVTRLTREVGWTPRTSLDDGLARTIAWWRREDGQ